MTETVPTTSSHIVPNGDQPRLSEFTAAFGRIGCLSFGGPAGQIALMHRDLVEERGWIDNGSFLNALNICHLLPGPEAQQLATYIGWRLHGWRGGMIAGLLFILPGALIMLGLSALYVAAAGLSWFTALFTGIKAAVLAIVLQALLRIAARALDTRPKQIIAVLAFAALAMFAAPFPLVVLGAGAVGLIIAVRNPVALGVSEGPSASVAKPGSLRGLTATIAFWGALWALPMIAIFVVLGPDHVLWQIGAFFSQLAVVTFGGAYAVLAYMAQAAVTEFGWLNAREMADGLGLAETTPGPLILVTQHVGFLAAFRDAAPFSPLMAGILGAALTTWVTFAPCFLWILALAPWVDRVQRAPWLKGALAAITAAVVGVIGSLTLWFVTHVLFTRTAMLTLGPIRFDAPVLSSFDWVSAGIAVVALIATFRFKMDVLRVLTLCATLGLLSSVIL